MFIQLDLVEGLGGGGEELGPGAREISIILINKRKMYRLLGPMLFPKPFTKINLSNPHSNSKR